jgi:type I restriction enzyme S subunit
MSINYRNSSTFPSVPIGEIALPHPGAIKIGPFGSQLKKEDMSREGYKVYGQENIIANDFSIGARRVNAGKFSLLSSCRLFAGDLVLTMMGTIGRCAIFPTNAELGIMDSHLLRIQVNSEIASSRFVAMMITAEEIVGQQIERLSHGSIMSGLSSTIVRRLEVPLPPLQEQHRIAQILDTLDTQIQETERLIAKLKQVKAGLLHDLLTKGIDENGEVRDPVMHPEWFKESPIGRIPKEWDVQPLKNLASSPITDFGSFSMTNLLDFKDSGIPFLRTEAIHDYGIDLSQIVFISESVHKLLPKSIVYPGDILFTKIGAIGRVYIYDGSLGECNSNAASAKIRLNSVIINKYFITHYLRSHMAKNQYLGEIISTPPRINLGQINALRVPLPPLLEQGHIANVLNGQMASISAEESRLSKLQQIKKGLMHDLLTGTVRVTSLMTTSEQ